MAKKLSLCRITKIFNKGNFNEVCALKNIILEFCPGENVLIRGHNGSGKSTLVNLIDGRIEATSGSIYIDSEQIDHLPTFKRARNVYRLFQESIHGVIPLGTIRENMAIARGRHGRRTWWKSLIKSNEKGMFEKVMFEFRPELSDKLDKKVFFLSPGERQALVLALLKLQTDSNPQILLADEPTASLDPELAKRCITLIGEYASRGWLCLSVTHDINFIQNHQGRIIELRNGEVIFDNRSGGNNVI